MLIHKKQTLLSEMSGVSKILGILLIFGIFGIFGIILFSFSRNALAAKKESYFKFDTKIQNLLESQSSNRPNIDGEALTPDIFTISFNTLEYENLINTYSTSVLVNSLINTKYLCNVDPNGIASVLYDQNKNFRTIISQSFTANVSKKQVQSVCEQITSCKDKNLCKDGNCDTSATIQKNSETLVQSCIQEINDLYTTIHSDTIAFSTIKAQSRGSELFWNNDTTDSSYDIIKDISDLGNLLFDGFMPPEKVVYYKMANTALPTMNNPDSDIDIPNERNRYNPNREKDLEKKKMQLKKLIKKLRDRDKTTQNTQGNDNNTNIDNSNNQNNTEDNTYNKALSLGNILVNTADKKKGILGNSCEIINSKNNPPRILKDTFGDPILNIHDDEESNTNSDILYQETIKSINKFFDALEKNAAQQTCNTNGICEVGENNSCPDCQASIESGDSLPVKYDDMTSPKDFDKVKGCMKKCDDNYNNAEDKFLCVMRCSCTTIKSKYWEDVPDLGNIFKINICLIPPSPSKTPRNAEEYSIEAIMKLLYGTLEKLADSGQLNVLNKTKDALSTSNENLKIGKTARFTLGFSTKPVQAVEQVHTQKHEAKERYKNTRRRTLGTSKQIMLDKNKYLLVGEKKTPISRSPSTKKRGIEQQNFDTVKLKKIDNFLNSNLTFWIDIQKKLKDFKSLAQTLENKGE